MSLTSIANDIFDASYTEGFAYAGGSYFGLGKETSDYRLFQTSKELERLAILPNDWDGRGSPAPSPENIEAAKNWVEGFWQQVRNVGLPWIQPLVSLDEASHVTFEWWVGEKKLTIYTYKNGGKFIKVWGSNIFSDMEEGELRSMIFGQLWRWLF